MEFNYSAKNVSFKGFDADYNADGITGPDDPSFAKRILCVGDSWQSIGAIPSSNMLIPLRFAQSTLLINLAQPGDTVKRMSDISSNPILKKLISDAQFCTKWDAIFISGGGNDLIDWAGQIICKPSVGAGSNFLDHINRIDLAAFSAELKKGFYNFADIRTGVNAKTPIVMHVYDYPTPRNAPAKFLGAVKLAGPWLYPALKAADVPESFWIPITDYVFETLGSTLIEIAQELENVHVITHTRGTLDRAKLGTEGSDGDWLNEIHPTSEGYKKLALIVSPAIQQLLS
jgi:lysophospholipase L1-like esterase